MPDVVIHPSLKLVKAGYVAIICLAIAALAGSYPPVPFILLIWPIRNHIVRRCTTLTIAGDKLRYETGLVSKSTRTIQLSKVQDIRVDRGVFQRMLSVGDLSIETAGESSRLTIANIDNPQIVADRIMDAAQQKSAGHSI